MGKKSCSQVAEDVIATINETEKAIKELTTIQDIKLLNYADWKIACCGRRAKGYTGSDLLFEAITQILEGRRRWRKNKVDFFGHFRGAIRSIASHFGDNFDDKVFFESEVSVTTEKGEIQSPINKTPSPATNQEENLATKQHLEEIEKLFSEDVLVLQIIEGLGCKMTGPEIQEVLNVSQKEYETAMKRMRRKVPKIIMKEKNNG